MSFYRKSLRRGVFSLLEIAVVVVVVGIVAAIVAPRMSRGAASSPQIPEQVLAGRLRAFRAALQAYALEHRGHFPDADGERMAAQLTQFTDAGGDVHATRTARHYLGPYLAEIPALPVGANRSRSGIGVIGRGGTEAVGWVYDGERGRVRPATGPNEADAAGRLFSSY